MAAATAGASVVAFSVFFRPYLSSLAFTPLLKVAAPNSRLSVAGQGSARLRAAPSPDPRQLSPEEEPPTSPPQPSPLPQPPQSPDAARPPFLFGVSASGLTSALASFGFVETAYLSYLKLTDTDAVCLLGGGSCGNVLSSDYSVVYGVPLPLIGMVAYGSVAVLSYLQSRKDLLPGVNETDIRFVILASTTSMAAATAYFLYLLTTQFNGMFCSYCLLSAFLSFSLFFLSIKDLEFANIQKVGGLQFAIAGIVVLLLINSYSSAAPRLTSSDDVTLERYETPITKESSAFALSLAKHLQSIGAKMYGAFWCSHCHEQKEMFGREAVKILDYVECFPDGAGKGRKMAAQCSAVGIEGFPTWIINDKIINGERDLSALAEASGFISEESGPS